MSYPCDLMKAAYISLMTENKKPYLKAAAARALAEAEARKAAQPEQALPPELGGREGPEPVRFGDWERKGIAVDF
jgi:hypothetical protein